MNTPRKRSTRSDSAAGKESALKAATEKPLVPPKHIKLRPGDRPFWVAITRARARETWNPVDLAKAANLARTQADIERISQEVEEEGDIVVNTKGTQIVNPKHNLLETLTRREAMLSRIIHVHAEATVGKSEDAAKKLKAEQEATKSVNELRKTNSGSDGLIAGVTFQ